MPKLQCYSNRGKLIIEQFVSYIKVDGTTSTLKLCIEFVIISQIDILINEGY